MSVRSDALRRIGTVMVALALAALLLRAQISSALVTRGDQLAFRGQTALAREMYARASFVDPTNAPAIDRFAFSAIMAHDRSALRRAATLLTESLRRTPEDLTLRMDRALCEQGLHDVSTAARDFAVVGIRGRDPRALMFAALDLAPSNRRYGEHLLRLALAADERFTPARAALARIKVAQ